MKKPAQEEEIEQTCKFIGEITCFLSLKYGVLHTA